MAAGPESGSEITRRSFLDTLLGVGIVAWAGSILFPIFKYLQIPERKGEDPGSVVAAKVADMKPNTGVVFKFGSEPALLVMGADGQFKAFSAVCTHLDCTVRYRPDLQKIHCACHGGLYDLNGRNVSGPPPRPLAVYKVTVRGEEIVVSKA